MQSRSLDVHGLKTCFDLLLALFQIWSIPEQLWLLGCSGRRSWKPRQRWGDNDWAGLVISFEEVVFLIHVSGSFILTKPKWDQILSAFKIGEIISCSRGFRMDWSSRDLRVGVALYSCLLRCGFWGAFKHPQMRKMKAYFQSSKFCKMIFRFSATATTLSTHRLWEYLGYLGISHKMMGYWHLQKGHYHRAQSPTFSK